MACLPPFPRSARLPARTSARCTAGLCAGLFIALAAGAGRPLAAQAVTPPPGQQPSAIQYDVRGLPLVEVSAAPVANPGAERTPAQRSVAILITGDGDWAAIDKGIAGALAQGGVPVVGLKARAYLQSGKRTPDGLAQDVDHVARTYLARWGRDRLILLGYSRGADYIPFVVNRLAPDLRERLAVVGMYGAEQGASFQFHFTDLFADTHRASDLPVAPELARMGVPRGVRVFCVYGGDEKDSACRNAESAQIRKIERGGAHHFDKDYAGLGRIALEELAREEPAR